eukprot:gene31345-35383_t
MALVDTTLYVLLHTVNSANNTCVTVLKTNSANGAVMKQAHLEGVSSSSSIQCTGIVRTANLPVGIVRNTEVRFSADSVEFTASPLPVTTSSVFLRATQSSLNSTRDSFTRVYAPTTAPSYAPV